MNTAVQTPEVVAAQAAQQAAEATAKQHAEIKANFNNLVDIKPTKFGFRKPPKDETTGVELPKRPTVEIPVPTPSVEGLIDIIQKGEKGLELLLESVYETVNAIARELINADENINADNFPYAKLSWEVIANMPKAERRGGGIAKETWDDFAADYINIMPGITGKKKESVELAAEIFLNKFQKCKHNKKIVQALSDQLGIYINNTTNGDQFAECVEFLAKKAQTILETDYDTALLEAL